MKCKAPISVHALSTLLPSFSVTVCRKVFTGNPANCDVMKNGLVGPMDKIYRGEIRSLHNCVQKHEIDFRSIGL